MGARQSVAQPPRQRNQSTTVANIDSGNSASTSGHTNNGVTAASDVTNGHTLGEPTVSGECQNRSNLLQTSSASGSSQQAPRPRQTRSRSVPMPPQDGVGLGVASTSHQSAQQHYHRHHNHHGHLQQRHHQHYRPHHFPIVARDQSSDSSGGGENDGASTTGISTVDRLLRFNSTVATSASDTGAGAAALWLPFAFRHSDMKCPVCHKIVPSDEAECHLVLCLTRPKIAYNEDVLSEDKGECVICFEEMVQGDTIARLPCLCIYHKTCIDSWFAVKNSCPEHPGDD